MRKLRIVGVDADSSTVECELPASGEKFTLPLDDRLRAAARGEFLEADSNDRTPVTGTMRPREIQERIRHGATAQEVASDAGVPLSRIEGFAVPVLLERATAADLAKNSHPTLSDGPSLDTLAERLASALDRRGVDPDLVTWDAWRDRSGNWVVRTSWPAGLSDDAAATWSYTPDSHGGAARALDEEAEGILDPNRATALRPVASAPPLPSGRPPIRSVPSQHATADESDGATGEDSGGAAGSGAAADASGAGASDASGEQGPPQPPRAPHLRDESAPGRPASGDGARGGAATGSGSTEGSGAAETPGAGEGSGSGSATGDDSATGDHDDDFLKHPPAEPERRSSRRHPTMPSWEDVLLGVRSKDD